MKKWVCSVCGYVYEGENPPEKCPVCKVPAEKFNEVKGEMSTYAIDLRAMTQSRGSFTLHFVRYEDCPPMAQEKAIAEAKALAEN